MTLANMRQEAASRLQRSEASIGTLFLNRWANQSLMEFGYAIKFPELTANIAIPTVVGTEKYAAPSDHRAWHEHGIWITTPEDNRSKLIKETRETWLRKFSGDTNDRAQPIYYHQYSHDLYLRPIPDAVYNLNADYWKTITKLVADGNKQEFPEEWDEAVVLGIVYRGHRHYNETDRKINAFNDYKGYIRGRTLEEDLEEFPEGGISVADWQATETEWALGR